MKSSGDKKNSQSHNFNKEEQLKLEVERLKKGSVDP